MRAVVNWQAKLLNVLIYIGKEFAGVSANSVRVWLKDHINKRYVVNVTLDLYTQNILYSSKSTLVIILASCQVYGICSKE